MLDLDQVEKLPPYQIKRDGQVRNYDTAVILEHISKEINSTSDLQEIKVKLSKIFDIPFTAHEAMLVMKDFEGFAVKFENKVKDSVAPFALFLHYYGLSPQDTAKLTPRMRLGLEGNIKQIQTIRILELSAAIGLCLAPSKAAPFLKELGIEIEKKTEQVGFDLHNSESAREALRRELGLVRKGIRVQ